MKRFYTFLLFSAIIISCKKENTDTLFNDDPSIFLDQDGRQLILHGLNTGSKNPSYDAWILESDVDREDKEFGFNFVRYLILWDGIEPQKDSFDNTYLDRIEERVNWYTSRGMYVMLDMHQDLYSMAFGGDGAPAWAIQSNGLPVNTENPYGDLWFLKSLDPALIASYQNFWKYSAYKEFQDHYILSWQKVAERFRNNPYVIGYDLMNEPYAGDLAMQLTGTFEKTQLKPFYDRLIPAIRAVDDRKYLFFEPTSLGINTGLPSSLPKINDARNVQRLAYAPHCYPMFAEALPGPYDAAAKQQVANWKRERSKEIKMQNCPMVIGEIGLSPELPGYDEYLDEVFNFTDFVEGGWAYWASGLGGWAPLNADRSESPIMQQLVRTYPKAVQGRINSFSFDRNTKRFTMSYQAGASIPKPTEIFVPERYYPSGYNLTVTGSSDYTQEYDPAIQVLKIKVKETKAIEIVITPK